jgi:hypothetical protein
MSEDEDAAPPRKIRNYRPGPQSAESRAKLSASMKRIPSNHLGYRWTPEQKARHSERMKRWNAERRGIGSVP